MERASKNVRLGMTMPLGSAADAKELTAYAIERGCEEVWLAEVNGGDAYALAGALAAWFPGIRLGTAVTPAQTRAAFVHAMSCMTLNQLTGGNFILGMGLSSPNIVKQWCGQPFDKPLARMRDHVTALRSLLSGQKTDYQGETLSVSKARLGGPIIDEVPIYLGALNKRMLQLTGELCDGVILNMVPEDALPQVLSEVRAGAEAAGRDPGALEVVSRLHVILTDDVDGARNLVRAVFGAYAATPGYNRFFRWIGYEEEGAKITERYAAKDREGVAAAVTPALCDAMAIVGDADTIRRRVRAYAESGVDVCVINPIGDPAGVRRTLDVLQDSLSGLSLTEGGVVRATRK